MKTIELIISPRGEVRLETHGFSGGNCVTAAEFLRKSLGQVVQETKTPAFYAADMESVSQLSVTPTRH